MRVSKRELLNRIKRLEVQLEESNTKSWYFFNQVNEPTIKGKVDAIISHLAIEFEYKPATEGRIVIKANKKAKNV